jgi:hypothetical protein
MTDKKTNTYGMVADLRPLMVIQAGAAQLAVLQPETQGVNQMKLSPGIGAEADDVTGIGRNLRLEQGNMEHSLKNS